MENNHQDTIISVRNLHKHFKVAVNKRGPGSAIRNLFSREYREVRAVDAINFTIQRGELVGYIGPNGAGKSTTMKMLAGLLVPTSGDLWVNGMIPWRNRRAHVAKIGAVFGQRTTLWWDLPVRESFDLLQHMYKIPGTDFKRSLDEFRTMLDLDAFIDLPVRSLSLGQRMRADICAALLHNPPLIFLDEPTIGLDVVAKDRIRRFIQHVNKTRQTTVILTTHDLSDVEKLCERVLIIDHGKLLYDGTLTGLRERFGGQRQVLVDLDEYYEDVSVPGAEVVSRKNGSVTYQFEQGRISASALIGQLSARFRIRDLTVKEPEIEETVRRIYEERLLD